MKKYKFDSDLKVLSHIKMPMIKLFFPIFNLTLRFFNKQSTKNLKKVVITKHKIKTTDGKIINNFLLEPNCNTNGTVFFIHGGAFITEAYPTHYTIAKEIAIGCNMKIFFVNYRLTPKYKYPVQLNDCFDSLNYLLKNKNKLNISDNIILFGDSAGGFLASSLALKAKDNNIDIKALMLLYPVLDYKMSFPSNKKYYDAPMWNGKNNEIMWDYLLEKDIYNDKYLNIIDNSLNLPNTYIEIAQYDPLHDEGLFLYEKLISLNKDCVFIDTKNTMHGYDAIRKANVTKYCMKKRIEFINKLQYK